MGIRRKEAGLAAPRGRSSTSRPANAATRLEQSSGRLFPTSTALTPLAPTMVTPTSSWKGSTSITTRQVVANMFQGQSSLIWNLERWTLSAPDPLVRSSDQTTLCLGNLGQETIGPRDTTLRGYWIWHGNTPHLQDQRRISGQDHEHVQRGPQPQGVGHSGGALQRHPLSAPTCGEHRRNLLH